MLVIVKVTLCVFVLVVVATVQIVFVSVRCGAVTVEMVISTPRRTVTTYKQVRRCPMN